MSIRDKYQSGQVIVMSTDEHAFSEIPTSQPANLQWPLQARSKSSGKMVTFAILDSEAAEQAARQSRGSVETYEVEQQTSGPGQQRSSQSQSQSSKPSGNA